MACHLRSDAKRSDCGGRLASRIWDVKDDEVAARFASAPSEVPQIRRAEVGLREDAGRPEQGQDPLKLEGVAGHLPLEGVAAHAVAARGRHSPQNYPSSTSCPLKNNQRIFYSEPNVDLAPLDFQDQTPDTPPVPLDSFQKEGICAVPNT